MSHACLAVSKLTRVRMWVSWCRPYICEGKFWISTKSLWQSPFSENHRDWRICILNSFYELIIKAKRRKLQKTKASSYGDQLFHEDSGDRTDWEASTWTAHGLTQPQNAGNVSEVAWLPHKRMQLRPRVIKQSLSWTACRQFPGMQ